MGGAYYVREKIILSVNAKIFAKVFKNESFLTIDSYQNITNFRPDVEGSEICCDKKTKQNQSRLVINDFFFWRSKVKCEKQEHLPLLKAT